MLISGQTKGPTMIMNTCMHLKYTGVNQSTNYIQPTYHQNHTQKFKRTKGCHPHIHGSLRILHHSKTIQREQNHTNHTRNSSSHENTVTKKALIDQGMCVWPSVNALKQLHDDTRKSLPPCNMLCKLLHRKGKSHKE